MKDSHTQNNAPVEPSAEETKLLQQLRANPVMAEKFGQIMDRFEQEIANGTDANQAEMMVIEELHQLGCAMLGQWAGKAHDKAIALAKEQDPALVDHTQKNSGGIPPSELSS